MNVQFTKSGRGLFVQVIQELKGLHKQRFKKEITSLFDAKITSVLDLPEYKITPDDIQKVIEGGAYSILR